MINEISGNLPDNWEWSTFGTIADFLNGRAFKKSEWSENGKPIIRIQNLTGSSNKLNRYSGPIENRYLIEDGDLLFSWSATLGAFVYRGEDAVLNQHIYKVIPSINQSYLYYLLNHYSRKLYSKVHGSGMQHITKTRFENMRIPIPPLNEQHRIVAKIEELFTKLDAGVEYLKQSKMQLEQYRQSVLKAAFEGKLTEEWHKEHSEITGTDYLIEMLGENFNNNLILDVAQPNKSDYWVWINIEMICEEIVRGITPRGIHTPKNTGIIPFIRVGNLTFDGSLNLDSKSFYIDQQTHEKMKRSTVIPGDVLMNITGPPLGKISIVPNDFQEYNINQAIARFRPKFIDNKYICYYLLSPLALIFFNEVKKATAGQSNLNLQNCRDLPIPIMGPQEQKRIVNSIETVFVYSKSTMTLLNNQIMEYSHLKQSILAKAFSGKLVPQDPSDAPADMLLRRIYEEKNRDSKSQRRLSEYGK